MMKRNEIAALILITAFAIAAFGLPAAAKEERPRAIAKLCPQMILQNPDLPKGINYLQSRGCQDIRIADLPGDYSLLYGTTVYIGE